MANYILSCCSTADLDKAHFEKRDIRFVSFHLFVDGKPYSDDFESISSDELYGAMEDGKETRTSQVNVDEFIQYFTPFLEQGLDILHVSLSSGLSGVYNSARIAGQELSELFPERRIRVIDSLCASSGYGLLMDRLADLRDEGMGLDELALWTEEHKLEVQHWFFSTDLSYYMKGGRLSKVSGWFGTILKICPLLDMNEEGKLTPRRKIRTKERVISEIVDRMEENARGGTDYDGKCFICHSACIEDAKAVAKTIKERFHNIREDIRIYSVGAVIGSHTGPGTVALFFWGRRRCE